MSTRDSNGVDRGQPIQERGTGEPDSAATQATDPRPISRRGGPHGLALWADEAKRTSWDRARSVVLSRYVVFWGLPVAFAETVVDFFRHPAPATLPVAANLFGLAMLLVGRTVIYSLVAAAVVEMPGR